MSLSNHKGTDLLYEVEIIEEDKKIEKIWFSLYEMERVNKEVLEKIENKINEIIDYLEENK